MPLTPFIGLSVLVHVVVIWYHKIFDPDNTKPAKKKFEYLPGMARFFGFVTIVLVFGFVLVNAVFLVSASVTEKHSSIIFVTHEVQNLINNSSQNQVAELATIAQQPALAPGEAMPMPTPTQSPASNATPNSDCAATYHDSLVSYLSAQGYTDFLSNQVPLAASAGITNYQATPAQNTAILNYLCQNNQQ